MKKLLATSAAMVLVAGAAVADVKVGGDGRMGVLFNDNGTDSGWNFTSRIRIAFTASGETDGGLAFGGSIRADNSPNGANGSAGNVFVSGAFGRLALGDVDSAAEAAVGDLYAVGLVDAEWDDFTYVGGNAAANDPVLLYTYTFASGAVYVSLRDGHTSNSVTVASERDTAWGVGAKYTFGAYTIGAGYEDNGTQSVAAISAEGAFGDLKVKAVYASYDNGPIDDRFAGAALDASYGLAASYVFDATTVSAYYRVADLVGGGNLDTYGLGASYNLGGGASIVGGWASKELVGGGSEQQASFGIALTF